MSKIKDPGLHKALTHLNKGGLHRALGVKEGEKIPASKLAAGKKSKSSHIRHMSNFASVMSKWNKK
jgi:hypothetical protein